MSTAKIKVNLDFDSKDFKKGMTQMKNEMKNLQKIASASAQIISKSFDSAYKNSAKASTQSAKAFKNAEESKVKAAQQTTSRLKTQNNNQSKNAANSFKRQSTAAEKAYSKIARSAEQSAKRQNKANSSVRGTSLRSTNTSRLGNNASQQLRFAQQMALQQQKLDAQSAMQRQKLAQQTAIQQRRLDMQQLKNAQSIAIQRQRLAQQAAQSQKKTADKAAQDLANSYNRAADGVKKAFSKISSNIGKAFSTSMSTMRKDAQTNTNLISRSLSSLRSQSERNFNAMASNMRTAFASVAAAASAISITQGIGDSTGMEMSYEASMTQLGRILGENAEDFKEWAAENGASLGMSQADLIGYGNTFSSILTQTTRDSAAATEETKKLMSLASNVSTATGRDISDVLERLRSGYMGNTEAIEDLGIYVNINTIKSTEAFKRFAGDKSWAQLDNNTQQVIRHFAIMEQGVKMYGEGLGDILAARHATFIAQLKDLKLMLGTAFAPVYYAILPGLTKFVEKMKEVIITIGQFTRALFGMGKPKDAVKTPKESVMLSNMGGTDTSSKKNEEEQDKESETLDKKAESADNAASSMDNLAKSTKEAAKASSASQQSFDKLNISESKDITKTTSSSGSGSSKLSNIKDKAKDKTGGLGNKYQAGTDKTAGDFDIGVDGVNSNDFLSEMEKIPPGVQKVADKVKDAFSVIKKAVKTVYDFLKKYIVKYAPVVWDTVKKTFNKIIKNAPGWYATIKKQVSEFVKDLPGKIEELKDKINLITSRIRIAFIRLSEFFSGEGGEKLKKSILKTLVIIGSLALLLKIVKIYKKLKPIMSGLFKLFKGAKLLKDAGKFSKAFGIIRGALLGISVPAAIIAVVIGGLIAGFINLYTTSDEFREKISETWGKVEEIFNNIKEIFQPAIDTFKEIFGTVWEESLKPAWEQVKEAVQNITDKFDKFLGKVNELLEAVKKPASEIGGILASLLGTGMGFLIDSIGSILGNMFELVGDLLGDVMDLFSGFVDFLTGVFSGDLKKALNGIKDIGKAVANALVDVGRGIINTFIGVINAGIRAVGSGIKTLAKTINMMDIDIPDWAAKIMRVPKGSKLTLPVDFEVPQIPKLPKSDKTPKLAKGGLIPPRNERTVIVGDNQREPEIVSPVSTMQSALGETLAASGIMSTNKQLVALMTQMVALMSQGQTIEVDGHELGRTVRRENVKYNKRTARLV